MGKTHIQFNALVMEMLGVFALNYIGGMSCYDPSANNVAGPLAHGLALGIFIWIGAATSGANYNPAVTVALMLTKNIDLLNGLLYIVAQVVGSFLAWPFVWMGQNTENGKTNSVAGTFPNLSGTFEDDWWKFMLLEFFATFFLVFVVFATAVDKRASPAVFGAAIGLTVTMSAFGIGGITGAALNPCRWLGPATMTWMFNSKTLYSGTSYWQGLCVYLPAPVLGGAAAGPLYQGLLLER